MIEWGLVRVAQALLGTDNAFSAVERGDRAFVPVISPAIFLVPIFDATIRNMPPFAFGIHNEQYDSDMVIIWGL